MATNLVERWQDLGPVLWLIAAGAAAVWFALLGLLAAATNPRAVRPGPATLELGGSEPPAVVNLLASDWRLAHQAIPATLLDLAARKHLAIDQYGDQTMVRVLAHPPTNADPTAFTALTAYERMVLDHLRGLAAGTSDGAIPAEALTTGPDEQSKSWWKAFRNAVNADARARGLSRRRWSTAARTVLSLTALVVAVAIALAVSSLPDDTSSSKDDDPAGAAVGVGVVTWGLLLAAVESMAAERDTRQGRQVAARWLGLREMLEEDHLFAEQPPAGVAIWDRHIAYGAALGVARGAVAALPLGAESDHEAWSPVGGRWRVVRIRYPERIPPGYGRHPFKVAALGLLQVAGAGTVLRLGPDTFHALRDTIRDTTNEQIPTAAGIALSVFLGALLAVAGLVLLRGAWMLLFGLMDLIKGHAPIEGRVLRHRERHVAVDDGTENRVRAWLLPTALGAPQGATVRAGVTRRLKHVEDLEVVRSSSLAGATGLDSV
ncbi:MAG TPA: hypothetical protein VGO78_21625, partial [Acidimicrobiales bacterium]|nr:hypothetical protein [Acidimicrobiales bacterium]